MGFMIILFMLAVIVIGFVSILSAVTGSSQVNRRRYSKGGWDNGINGMNGVNDSNSGFDSNDINRNHIPDHMEFNSMNHDLSENAGIHDSNSFDSGGFDSGSSDSGCSSGDSSGSF